MVSLIKLYLHAAVMYREITLKKKKLIDTDFNTERLETLSKKIPQQSRIVKFVIVIILQQQSSTISHTL